MFHPLGFFRRVRQAPARMRPALMPSLLLVLVLTAACSALPTGSPALPPSPSPSAGNPTPTATAAALTAVPVAPGACVLPAIVPPTPAPDPGYAELDPSTGLHMTGQVQQIDLASYRLRVTGKVNNPLALTYDELRCLPRVQARPNLICPGFFVDEATWAGASLASVIALADPRPDATQAKFKSADGYYTDVTLDMVWNPENFLAYEWEGQPLPILHGFPVRVVWPSLSGNRWVQWLVEIEVN